MGGLIAIPELIVLLVIFTGAFNQLSGILPGLAIDWKTFWAGTHGLRIEYAGLPLFNPPWTLALLWPFSVWPLALSWSLASIATISVLVASVPRDHGRTKWYFGLLALAFSYPFIRQLVEVNLEGFVVVGLLLLLWSVKRESGWGTAIAILLLTAKIQATWIVLVMAVLWILISWPRHKAIKVSLSVFLIIAPSFAWKGRDWLENLGRFPSESPYNSSLLATLARLEVPEPFRWSFWLLLLIATLWLIKKIWGRWGRLETGWMILGSLLLAPYSASNSTLTPLAIGVIPLIQRQPWLGLPILALYNLPLLVYRNQPLRQQWEWSYWTLVLLLSWLALGWVLLKQHIGKHTALAPQD